LIPDGSQAIVTACRTLSVMPARYESVAMESIALAASAV
jgi:hypothetical protein